MTEKRDAAFVKLAKIFGNSLNYGHFDTTADLIEKNKDYVKYKAEEEPTSYLTAGVGGAAIGAGVGRLSGLGAGPFAISGALAGILLSWLDRNEIDKAKMYLRRRVQESQ